MRIALPLLLAMLVIGCSEDGPRPVASTIWVYPNDLITINTELGGDDDDVRVVCRAAHCSCANVKWGRMTCQGFAGPPVTIPVKAGDRIHLPKSHGAQLWQLDCSSTECRCTGTFPSGMFCIGMDEAER